MSNSSTEKEKMLPLKNEFALELENLLIWSLSDADLQELAQRLTDKTKMWLEQKNQESCAYLTDKRFKKCGECGIPEYCTINRIFSELLKELSL